MLAKLVKITVVLLNINWAIRRKGDHAINMSFPLKVFPERIHFNPFNFVSENEPWNNIYNQKIQNGLWRDDNTNSKLPPPQY